ncbi:unnamed protein product [Phytophthora fragariaefolia]|uniref:Unnamed protein product n=1 Tax=Phytophthora fragariaefolia TaxID=1490495 RepID=A0A9W6Y6G4_9STRA|nr:unnamed protein product [Phytophthora fragariaefolia]
MVFASELAKFGVPAKADGVQRLASDLSAARAALQLENAPARSAFQAPDDVPSYTQKLAAYLALVKGFTESPQSAGPKTLPASAPAADASVDAALRQPLVESSAQTNGAPEAANAAGDCSGCLNFCRWQDALTGQTVCATSARQEAAHVLLAAGIMMMTDARDKVDAILSERLSELDETQLKLAYQLLLHAAGVLDACLESMDVTPRSIGAEFADLGAKAETTAGAHESADSLGAAPDDDMMTKWREEQRQAQKAPPSSTSTAHDQSTKSSASVAAADLDMLKCVPDLADGRFPQLLAWIALAEAQELVVLRGVTRETVDFTLMAKLSMDISARYKECQTIASRLLPCSTSTTAERIRLYCAFKEPYYQVISTYFQGAACMLHEDARNCAQAVANFKKAVTLIEGVAPLEKGYEAKMASDKEEKERVALLAAVFLRSQQIVSRDLDIVSHRNDSVYYEPVSARRTSLSAVLCTTYSIIMIMTLWILAQLPAPEIACNALSLVKPTTFPVVTTSDLWRDGEVANCLMPTPVGPMTGADANQQQQPQASRPREGCCSSCIIS